MEKIYNYLKENGTFYYATIDGDRPSVRPFGFLMKYEDHIYISMGDHKKCYKQTIENSNICILSMGKGSWLRLFATAIQDTREEVSVYAREASPSSERRYSKESGLVRAIFRLENCYAELTNSDGTIEVTEF